MITLNRSTTPPLFKVSVGSGGIVTPGIPLLVDVTVLYPNGAQSGTTPFGKVVRECASPGGTVLFALTLGTYQCTYADPGTYNVKVTVLDSVNVAIFTDTKRVTVKAATDNIAVVRAVYGGLLSRLAAGNTSGAANLFTEATKAKYSDIFSKLAPSLASYLSQIGQIGAITAADDHAEIVVIRTTGGVSKAYSIYLFLGGDGIWRIESM